MKKILAVVCALAVVAGGYLLYRHQTNGRTLPQDICTIRVALWDYGVVKYDKQIVEAFEKANPDIHVDVISYPSEYYSSSVKTLMNSGEQVDVVYANQMAMLRELQEDGFALSLDEFAQRDGSDLQHYLFLDLLRDDSGKLSALPYRMDKFVLYYNKDLFDRAGMPYPTDGMTWTAFQQMADQLQTSLHSEEQHSVYSIFSPTHWSELLTSEPFRVFTCNLDELRRGLDLLNEMQQTQSMVSISRMRSILATQRVFENGQYGMFISGTWMMHFIINDVENGDSSLRWGVTSRPQWEGAENKDAAWITSLCINRESAHTEAAWKFVQYVCGEKGAKIMTDHLMIPAYHTSQIDAALEKKEKQYGVSLNLRGDGFDTPQVVKTEKERKQRQKAIETIGRVMLGTLSVDDGIAILQRIQMEYTN